MKAPPRRSIADIGPLLLLLLLLLPLPLPLLSSGPRHLSPLLLPLILMLLALRPGLLHPESADEGSNALSKTLQLGSLFGLWYLFNIYNKQMPTTLVVASLVPIVDGVALASVTEASFNWAGFGSAMASNLTFQSRNVLKEKVMVNKEETMDNINLFSTITVMSFFLLAPVAIFMEGVKFTELKIDMLWWLMLQNGI
ncbi:hypothetical protein K1719_025574 [Acacia pycnantha]|nr:hypothetical protein K1719_025574 [Acacia pycnantha]